MKAIDTKLFCLILMTAIALSSCNKQREVDTTPNYFKHGMKGNVESVFTQTFSKRNGIEEEWPKIWTYLLGDKFDASCSRKKFDKNGHLIEKTTYHDWKTYTDSTVVTYKYDGNHLVSSSSKEYTRKYTTPSVDIFEYSESGDMSKWGDKVIKLNENKQISEISYSELCFSFINVFNDEGIVVAQYTKFRDDVSYRMAWLNTFDENGNIIKQEELNTNGEAYRIVNIIYTQFDHFGNWTQRLNVRNVHPFSTESLDTLIQYRNIKYYDIGINK